MEVESYSTSMNKLVELIKEANFIWIAGNGGSAATAEHFATDLVKKGYRAIALSSNTSVMTMIANDYGYEQIFAKQLGIYGSVGDLLIVISCSGSSVNIINAILMAMARGIQVYHFENFKKDKDYGKLENKHLKLVHDVVKLL